MTWTNPRPRLACSNAQADMPSSLAILRTTKGSSGLSFRTWSRKALALSVCTGAGPGLRVRQTWRSPLTKPSHPAIAQRGRFAGVVVLVVFSDARRIAISCLAFDLQPCADGAEECDGAQPPVLGVCIATLLQMAQEHNRGIGPLGNVEQLIHKLPDLGCFVGVHGRRNIGHEPVEDHEGRVALHNVGFEPMKRIWVQGERLFANVDLGKVSIKGHQPRDHRDGCAVFGREDEAMLWCLWLLTRERAATAQVRCDGERHEGLHQIGIAFKDRQHAPGNVGLPEECELLGLYQVGRCETYAAMPRSISSRLLAGLFSSMAITSSRAFTRRYVVGVVSVGLLSPLPADPRATPVLTRS